MAKINPESWEKKNNGWVFLSHSSKDYDEVKVVRNYLEENNFNALMFYLKCLDDNPEDDETQNLIFREIRARNIFVLCNSKHTSISPWVQKEIAYVKKEPYKIYREVDIDNMKVRKCTELSKLDDLMNTSTLFFSYSHHDKKIVDKVYAFLANEGFKIFYENKQIKAGDNFINKISDSLEEASKSGYLLLFISQNALKSRWLKYELDTFLDSSENIIPILVDRHSIDDLPFFLQTRQFLNISDGRFEKNMNQLLGILKNTKLSN